VKLDLVDGGIGIRPGHAPLLAETVTGSLRFGDEDGEHSMILEAGLLHIDQNSVTISTGGLANTEPTDELINEVEAHYSLMAQTLFTKLNAQPGQGVEIDEREQ
jgi:F0F1-type ATP synthase epsilon subunit